MKPIYKSLALAAMTLSVSLSLQAQVKDGDGVTETAVEAASLDGLKVELISPNVTGARDLIASGECVIDGADLNISLNTGEWLKGGTYSVRVSAVFGTQTVVLYVLNIDVPRYEALASEPQEHEDEVVVVSTIGDGDKSGADATVYAKDGDGNAHITKPLSVGGGVADSIGAVASGRAGDGASIQATSDGAVASGYTDGEGARIEASGDGAVASGRADGDGASIEAGGEGAVASGYTDGDGANIQATGDGAVASGYAGGGASIQANGAGAIASGRAYGDGASIQAVGEGAVASGYADGDASIQAVGDGAVASGRAGDGASIQAVGDGAVASGRAYGEGARIEASGDGAVASGRADGDGASIEAVCDGAVASGYADETGGNVEAKGNGSQAFGMGTQTQTDGQMVLGKCNVLDTDGDYALIVGNGANDQNRSNAFAIDWNGNLVLFNAGTPVVLTPAKLAALIA